MKTNQILRVVCRPMALSALLLVLSMVARSAPAQPTTSSNGRYQDLIIEYLALEPQIEVNNVGDGPHRPEAGKARLTAFLFNLRETEVYAAIDWADAAPRQEIGNLLPGESKAVSISIDPAAIPYGKPIVAQVYNMEIHKLEETDRATLHGEKTMRVALLVERRTWDEGNKKFGSFSRHMRESLESLHELFDGTAGPTEAGLARSPIVDRFRIERVELFDRPADSMDASVRPALFDAHPSFDVVVVCDENGPFTGYWQDQHTVGYDFAGTNGNKGLASKSAQQVLWNSLMQFRGVPDYSLYRIPAGALPGRTDEPIDLPAPFRGDLMNGPSDSPRLGALAAAITNSNAGVSRLGSSADPANEFGHTWRWIPASLRVRVVDAAGKPVTGLKASWYRSLPLSASDQSHGVGDNRTPDGTASSNAEGEWVISGDYLGARSKDGKRSLWMLVEVEDGAGARRFAVVSGLWLNAAYAAGSKQEAVWIVRFDEMRPVR